ncbi:MAG: hypothetical protein ACKVZJ_09530 [Phycisphaerales bacterium]
MRSSGTLIGASVMISLLASMSGCASGGRSASAGPARSMEVEAVALRVVGGKIAQDKLAALGASPVRGAVGVERGSTDSVLAELRTVADVEVLGRPSVMVTPTRAGTLRMGGTSGAESAEMGFLSGVHTDVRLCLESSPARERGSYGLKVSGSVLQFTPDKTGAGSANAAYTRLRDFESDLSLRPGQPALVAGPALVEQADGVWTGVVILLTPRASSGTGAGSSLASVEAEE